MKKLSAALLLFAFVLCLSGCSAQPKSSALYVEPARLTAQEENISTLLGADGGKAIYDFVLDKTVQSVSINTYRLVEGAWEPVSEGWQQFSDNKGRLALGFDNIADGVRIALQSEKNNGATTYTPDSTESHSDMACSTAYLSDTTAVVYDEPIPLAVQITSSKNQIELGGTESFFAPEEYAELGHEFVYAITVSFSQKTVAELEAAA